MLPKYRPPMHPGKLLERALQEIGMTQAKLAKELGVSLQTVNTLINGRRGMTAALAVQLGRLFKTTPQMWMNLQTNRDLWFAMHERRAQRRASPRLKSA
jgi:addiction module HigA family antidote